MAKTGPPAVFEAGGDGETQNKILDTATHLFALKGFKAVTLKDIAKVVGIKIASIYYYYEDKDALIEDVMRRFERVYKNYQDWLAKANEKAETLDEVIGNLFHDGVLDTLSPVARLGISMTLKGQHSHDSSYDYAFKFFYRDGIANVQKGFDRLIERGLIPPSDTKTLATIFMFCILSANEAHIHEFAGEKAPIDYVRVKGGLKKLMTQALLQGTVDS